MFELSFGSPSGFGCVLLLALEALQLLEQPVHLVFKIAEPRSTRGFSTGGRQPGPVMPGLRTSVPGLPPEVRSGRRSGRGSAGGAGGSGGAGARDEHRGLGRSGRTGGADGDAVSAGGAGGPPGPRRWLRD